jgi:hypothetical protein
MKNLKVIIFGFCFIIILLSISGITNRVNSEPEYVLNSKTYNICNELFFSEITEIQINQNENLYNILNAFVSNPLVCKIKTSFNRIKTQSVKLMHQNENSFHTLENFPKVCIQKSAFADLRYLKFLKITKMLC